MGFPRAYPATRGPCPRGDGDVRGNCQGQEKMKGAARAQHRADRIERHGAENLHIKGRPGPGTLEAGQKRRATKIQL